MQFSLLLLGAPYSTQSTTTAYRFAKAALKAGHSVYRVFFYHDAVYCANQQAGLPQDEQAITKQWAALAKAHSIDLVVCVTSALKRGIPEENKGPFKLSGLGQLIDATLVSDRFITFGP